MSDAPDLTLDASALRIGLAVSRYHAKITDSMRDAAIDAFVQAGGSRENLVVVEASGTWELTAICRALATLRCDADRPAISQEPGSGRPDNGSAFDALIAIGCVIAGETLHDQYIAQSVTQGLTALTVETGTPIAFGVLTCQNLNQAMARSIEAGASTIKGKTVNKGAEAMRAAIVTANTLRQIAAGSRKGGR